jgi:hypothetical protein
MTMPMPWSIKKPFPYFGSGMDFYARYEPGKLGNDPGDQDQPETGKKVGQTVQNNGMETRDNTSALPAHFLAAGSLSKTDWISFLSELIPGYPSCPRHS